MAERAGRGVRRQFAGLFTARLGAAALAFGTTVIAARYLGPEAFGRFSILVVLSKVVFDLVSPALDTAAVRFTARESARSTVGPEAFFRCVVRLKAGLVGAIVVSGLVLSAPFKMWFLPDTPTHSIPVAIVFLAFLTGAFQVVWSIAQVYFQSYERFDRMAAFEALHALLRFAVFAALVGLSLFTTLRFGEAAFVAGQAAAVLGVGLLALAFVPQRYLVGPVPADAVRAVLGYGKWILAACACTALSQAVDVFVLAGLQVSPEIIGNYRAAVTLILVGELAILTLFQVLLPKASRLTTKGELSGFLRRYQLRGAAAGMCLVPAIAAAPFAAAAVFGSAYETTGGIFAVLLVGTAFMVSTAPAGAVVYSAGRARLIAGLELAKLGLVLVLGIPATLMFGAYGMAASAAFSRALIALCTLAAARWAVAHMPDKA